MDFGCKSTLNLVQVNNKAGLKHSVSGNFSMTPSKLSSSPVKKRQEAPIINNVTQINLCETNIEEKRENEELREIMGDWSYSKSNHKFIINQAKLIKKFTTKLTDKEMVVIILNVNTDQE